MHDKKRTPPTTLLPAPSPRPSPSQKSKVSFVPHHPGEGVSRSGPSLLSDPCRRTEVLTDLIADREEYWEGVGWLAGGHGGGHGGGAAGATGVAERQVDLTLTLTLTWPGPGPDLT